MEIRENSKKGISLILLIIIIVLMIILSSTVVTSFNDEDVIEKANATVIKNDIQTMIDNYQAVYENILYNYAGDTSLITDDDFQNKGIIKDKYSSDFTVGKNGITYIGKDDEIATIAAEMNVTVSN